MRSSGVRLVVLGGIVALLVIWLGIRPGTRRAATAPHAVEPMPPPKVAAPVAPAPPAPREARRFSRVPGVTVTRRDPRARAPETEDDGASVPPAAAPAPREAATPPSNQVDMSLNPPEDIPTLGRMALTDPDPERRAAAGVLLAATENPRAVPLLRQALSDSDAGVRHSVVKEIADVDFAANTTIDLLTPVAMKDAESTNRIAALEALAGLGGDRVMALAKRLQKDDDPQVRIVAQKILHHETVVPGASEPTATD